MRHNNVFVASMLSFLVPFAYNLTKIALPLKYVSAGISLGMAIIPVLVSNTVQVLFRPIFGSLSEKFGHKKIFGFAPLLYALAFYAFVLSRTPLGIYIASMILALGVSSFWTAFLAYSSYLGRYKAEGVAIILTVSYIGAFFGTILSGFALEIFGIDGVLLFASLIMVVPIFFYPFIELTGSMELLPIKQIFGLAIRNIGDVLFVTNSIALVPIINVYAPLILINSGLKPSIVGIIITILPLMSAIMQQFGGRFYHKIVPHREKINTSALLALILFAFSSTINLPLTILAFFIFAVTSSLLFTPQLTKSIKTNKNARGVGSGGFGAGMTITRVLASSLATTGGYLAEAGIILLYPPVVSIVFPAGILIALTVTKR